MKGGYDPEKMLGVQSFTVRGVDAQVCRRFRALSKLHGITQPSLLRAMVIIVETHPFLILRVRGGVDAKAKRSKGAGRRRGRA